MMKRSLSLALLFATATAAAAEVKISGYGRFGLDYNDRNASSGVNGIGAPANGVSSTTITSRLRLQFDFSTETDGAVTLGSRLRVEAESRDNVAVTPGFNGAYFFARYGGMTVGVGNILGAIDAMPGFKINNPATGIGIDGAGFHDEVANVAANVAGQFGNWDAYSSTAAGPNGLEILYKSGAFSGHLSYSRTNTDIAPVGDGIPGMPRRPTGHVSR
ncbi:porin [Seohaeicola zhoushanensis]